MKIAWIKIGFVFSAFSLISISCSEAPKSKAKAPADPCADSGWGTPAPATNYDPSAQTGQNTQQAPQAGQQPQQGFNLLAAKNYNDDAKIVFDEFCVSCHKTGGNGAAAGLLDTYAGIKAFDKAILEKSVADPAAAKPMPPLTATPLDNIKKSILADFFAGGLIEETILNYTDNVSVALKADCIECHDGTNVTIPDLTTFEGAKAEGANLALSLQDTSIHTGLSLPAGNIALFEEWESLGFPEGKDSVPEPEPTDETTKTTDATETATTTTPVATTQTQQPFSSTDQSDCYLPTDQTPTTGPNTYQNPPQTGTAPATTVQPTTF